MPNMAGIYISLDASVFVTVFVSSGDIKVILLSHRVEHKRYSPT